MPHVLPGEYDIRGDFMVKKIVTAIVLLVILGVSYLGIYTSEDIGMNVNGITYKLSDDNYENKVVIKVDGKLLQNKFNQKKFNGDIYINDIELKGLDLKLDNNNTASLEECGKIDLEGRFYIDKEFNNVLLYLYGGYLGNTEIVNHMIIAGPADNRKEAFQLTKDLSKGQ